MDDFYRGPEGTEQQPISADAKSMGMLMHLSTLSGFVVPFGNIIAPLIIWAVKKDESPFINDQGKEVVNFQLSVTIYAVICAVLILVVIGLPMIIGLAVFILVYTVIGAMRANEGVYYRYPLNLRLMK